MLISLVVPCYNEEESLPIFYKEASKIAQQMGISHGADFEFIFVDDGSKDRTLQIARELHRKDARVRYISFSRNFGKEAGIYAGLKAAKGDYVATMDADLQDPPSLLPEMLELLLSGEYDCAATRRTTREGEPPVRSWFAKKFYQIINKLSDTEIVDGARDFRLMSRKMTDAVLSMAEYNRFSKGIFSWVGFKTKWIDYKNVERVAGTTKWNFWGLLKYSIEGIVGFSTAPLLMAAGLGLAFCVLAFVGIMIVVVRALMFGDPLPAGRALSALSFCAVVCSCCVRELRASTLPKHILKQSTDRSILLLRPKKIWTRNKAFQEKCIFNGVPEEADLAPRFF